MDKDDKIESIYESDSGEISFKKLGIFLKQSLLRMAIYIVAAVILVTGFKLFFNFTAQAQFSASAMIEYTFKGIDEGKNPDGSGFNKDAVKNAGNVRETIEKVGLSDKLKSDVDTVRNNISIRPVMPNAYIAKYNELILSGLTSAEAYAQLNQMTFYPTKFIIEFYNYRNMNLSDEDAVRILNQLIEVHVKEFIAQYSKPVVINDALFSGDAASYDYSDYYALYSGEVNSIKAYLSQQVGKDSTFISTATGKSFASLITNMEAVEAQLKSYNTFVSKSAISNDVEKLLIKVKGEIDAYELNIDREEKIIMQITQQLKDYPYDEETIVENGVPIIIKKYPQEYNDLQKKLTGYYESKADLEMRLIERQDYYKKLGGDAAAGTTPEMDEEAIKKADKMLEAIQTSAKGFIREINATSEDFMKISVNNNSLRTVTPASYASTMNASFPTMLAYIGGIGAAVVMALLVTFIMNRIKARKVKPADESGEPKTE